MWLLIPVVIVCNYWYHKLISMWKLLLTHILKDNKRARARAYTHTHTHTQTHRHTDTSKHIPSKMWYVWEVSETVFSHFGFRHEIERDAITCQLLNNIFLVVIPFSHESHMIDHKCSTNGVSIASIWWENPRCENTVSDTSHTYHILICWMWSVSSAYPRSHTLIIHKPFWFSSTFSHTSRGCFSNRFQIIFSKWFEVSCGKAQTSQFFCP